MEKKLFHINILGTALSLQTDEDSQRMDEIVQFIKDKTDYIENNLSVKDPLKNLIISSIMIVDELLKEKNRNGGSGNQESEEVERLTLQIMERIDRSLE